jgi:enamine deaminase RidA (YjgF/YER057c/UK114 family)
MTVPTEEAPANYVPAAAVIRRVQALSGIIGRKASAGGQVCLMLNTEAQLRACIRNCSTRVQQRKQEFPV